MAISPLPAEEASSGPAPSYLPANTETYSLGEFIVNGSRARGAYTVDRSLTATKTDTPLIDTPQSISVVTRELIDDQDMLSIGDVTRYVPGVGIAQGEGNRDTPVMRGSSMTADFYINGVRDDVQYYRDLYNVDRVEVLKGPNAMIFGRGGSGGVINRVTRQADGRPHRQLAAQGGSWDLYRSTLDWGDALNDVLAYRLDAVFEDSGSYRDGDTLRRYGVNPTFAYQIAPATTLRFGYEYFRDERVGDRGVPSYLGRPVPVAPSTFFGNPAQSPVHAQVSTAYATLTHRFAPNVTLRNTTRFGGYDKFYQNVFPGAVNPAGTLVALQGYNNHTQRDNLYNQTDLVLDAAIGSVAHKIVLGTELGRQVTDNFRNTAYFDTVAPGATSIQVPLASPRTSVPAVFRQSATDASNHGVADTAAVYVQDQMQLTSRWLAVAGLRFDYFGMDFRDNRAGVKLATNDGMLSPRAGLVYKARPDWSVYASYSTTFVPRAGDQLASLKLTNHNLDPEEFRNYEVGLKWDARPDLAFTAATYRLDRTNVAATDPTDPTRSVLVDGQRASGVELGLTGRLSQAWSVAGGYAYQDGRILSTQSATIKAGARLAQLPRHTFSLWNRANVTRNFGAGLGVIYRDAFYASTDNTVVIPGFTRVDAAAYYRVNDHLRLQLNVENLLDRRYFSAANSNNNITPGSPRAFRLGATLTY